MELMTRRETWHINYRHALGATASHFFANIRDKRKAACGFQVAFVHAVHDSE